MTSTARKRLWRERNPDRSREAERVRAQARRRGYWGVLLLGQAPRLCASEASYRKYEFSVRRMLQKTNWRVIGPGSMQMSHEEREAAIDAHFREQMAALETRTRHEFGDEMADMIFDRVPHA